MSVCVGAAGISEFLPVQRRGGEGRYWAGRSGLGLEGGYEVGRSWMIADHLVVLLVGWWRGGFGGGLIEGD